MKKVGVILLLVTMLVGMAACAPNKEVDLSDTALVLAEYPEGVSFEDYDGRREIWKANQVSEDFHRAFDTFTYHTAAQIFDGSENNQLYSPMSLYYGVALATMGAKGQTQTELLELLGMPDLESLEEQCGNVYRLIYKDNEISKLRIANSLWMDRQVDGQEVNFGQAYLTAVKDHFYASIYSVDFSNPKTGDLMGAWISDQTQGTLDYVFDPDPQQIMTMINTIYFYDEWTDRFNKDKTKEDEFHLSNGEGVMCDFMHTTYGSHAFVDGDGFTSSQLALKEAGSMIFILPDQGVSIEELLSRPEGIQALFESGQSQSGQVIWQVPKFTYGISMDLMEAIQALGVEEAFSPRADFSGMVDGPVFISDIKQKTHIGIDENGVEASAYTEIAYAGAAEPTGKAEMILDRPFIYAIQSNTGDCLFMGICQDPSQE